MDLITITAIAVGLAMDAFAVSVVSGVVYERLHVGHVFRMAVFFGGFQAFMPLIGFLAAKSFAGYISGYDHWVAFAILMGVGVKMIYESREFDPLEKSVNPANMWVLLMLSVATSIDALAVGITLSLVAGAVIKAVIIIGVVTFVLSYAGVYIGRRFRHFFERKVEVFGGLVLIGLGVKILVEGLFQG
jgi:putative Mn2+ efflux pump MntP